MFDFILHRDRESAVSDDVRKIEEKLRGIEAAKKDRKSGWDVLQIMAGVLSPVVLAVLAYFLTGKITLALQEKQVNLAAGKEIQGLMSQAMTATEANQATAAAVGLASYGDISIPPLTYLMRSGSANAALAAVEGLRAAATTHPDAVCRAMHGVIENQTQMYSWENHRTAIELIGQLRCADGRNWLDQYKRTLDHGGQAALARIVSPNPAANRAAVNKLEASIQIALHAFP